MASVGATSAGSRTVSNTASERPFDGEYDVIVAGGGPGGSATAAFLAREGINVLLLEKARYPRDKTCGDAISGKSATVLRELGIIDQVEAAPHSIAEGVRFSGPDGDELTIPFPKNVDPNGIKNSKKYNYVTPGYVARRLVFDNIVFQHAKAQKSVTTIEEFEVKDVLFENGKAVGVSGKDADGVERRYGAKVVVGADGAMSVVAQKVGVFDRDHDHWLGAFRVYYEGVTGMTKDIEIHFVDGLIPGYFWIFPLENGLANVGSGMVETDLQAVDKNGKKKVQLVEDTYKIIREHPKFKDRFKDAKELPGTRKGWLLPVGSKRRTMHGNGWVLVGDAAALIDPFSGEGIGNAMVSGRLAAATITKALAARDTGAAALAPYEAAVRAELDRELMMSYKLQKLGRHTWLLNFVLRRAAKKPQVRDIISQMLADREKKEEFGSVWFYIKLLLM
ncbi:MAG TPA: geranylgeranyl reductase family protein [Candidatus Thermoplasmatota archaeon]|nr:geranylgeranyl reductase family protein [Candidatus Thermoplasmatota archaeon]